MRPLPDVPSDPAVEPHLELVPDVGEAETVEAEYVVDAEDVVDAEVVDEGKK